MNKAVEVLSRRRTKAELTLHREVRRTPSFKKLCISLRWVCSHEECSLLSKAFYAIKWWLVCGKGEETNTMNLEMKWWWENETYRICISTNIHKEWDVNGNMVLSIPNWFHYHNWWFAIKCTNYIRYIIFVKLSLSNIMRFLPCTHLWKFLSILVVTIVIIIFDVGILFEYPCSN